MPENTDHPTQKPEKLLAKIILASTDPNSVVFDPFLGSGTSAVVATKLGRQFVGVEIDPVYCGLTLLNDWIWQKQIRRFKATPTVSFGNGTRSTTRQPDDLINAVGNRLFRLYERRSILRD